MMQSHFDNLLVKCIVKEALSGKQCHPIEKDTGWIMEVELLEDLLDCMKEACPDNDE